MTITTLATSRTRRAEGGIGWLEANLPKIVLAPSFALTLVFVYGFILWTVYLSFSKSRLVPNYDFVGLEQYYRLWSIPNWYVALINLAIYGTLYITLSLILGLLIAILLDQRIRAEGLLRAIYLYPMAVSFIVTGTAWQWFLNPGLGLDRVMHAWGWQSFTFDWLIDPKMAIYTIVIAGVWQTSGFVMAMFLAGLRGIDNEIIKAAQIDGASTPNIYWRVIIRAA
ncbi:ABC-type sugar transport system permease subunit [Bradyrhizobium sp. LM2.7]